MRKKLCEMIVPLISSWMQEKPNLIFVQDGAASHSAFRTLAELSINGIQPMAWPAYYPDLNLTEATWSQMKDFVEHKYPDSPCAKEHSYDKNCVFTRTALGSVILQNLAELVRSLPRRCQAVINPQGNGNGASLNHVEKLSDY